jgi:hypothetical protein
MAMSRKHRWYSARPPDTEKKPEPRIEVLCFVCSHRVPLHFDQTRCPHCGARLTVLRTG